ncbi:MAG: glutamine-hydrolyzing carbamoyl-phosphate synthase small subunit [Rickettsiales bacterium]|jgi:carbamoyl-phosphate synthase small subunit|nr:glutamine-hydrolyzing carbamoyl-phosphate synthase small subunit [Rickettsiales bacterium]
MPKHPYVKASAEINAALILSNGEYFFGRGIGAKQKVVGEVCFNTSITGYQEILTDPSYTGQIINFTAPHIGNVGCNAEDAESAKFANGLIICDDLTPASNFRSENDFNNWLINKDLSGICGIDTRHITNLIRDKGVCTAIIAFCKDGEVFNIDALLKEAQSIPSLGSQDLASKVSTNSPYIYNKFSYNFARPAPMKKHDTNIVVLDFGIKDNILNCLLEQNCQLHVLSSDTSFDEIMQLNPDGIFLSNGPGDPIATAKITTPVILKILENNIPLFGICLGHQLLAIASGLTTEKMHQGHRGANHPVINLRNKKVEITSQNHGFCVSNKNLPENIEVTHLSLFDNTIEGFKIKDKMAFAVQYHPESSPGPHDSKYLFDDFIKNVIEYKKSKSLAHA